MPELTLTRLSLLIALIGALITPAHAQYDRDGRYVPSPNGVPTDPSARPIPMYSGTPGDAIGTPILPRQPSGAPPRVINPRAPEDTQVVAPPVVMVPLSREQCARGWSAKSAVPRVEFNRRCARMRNS